MNCKKYLINLFLVVCLSVGATLLFPVNKAQAYDPSAVWKGCKTSISGAGVASNGKAWAIMNTGNKACRIKINIVYYNAKKQRILQSTGWYQQKTIGLTASQSTVKNSKVVFYFYVDGGAFGTSSQIIPIWT